MLKIKQLNILIVLGFLSIVGVLVIQINLISQAYQYEQKGLNDKIHFALKDVLQKIHMGNQTDLPYNNQIQKITSDYYIVNVNDLFDNNVLEYYLKNEFEKVKLDLDYEYAIYDCATDEMIYGNYVSKNQNIKPCDNCFKKDDQLIYYFGIRFPKLKLSVINALSLYWALAFVLFLILIIYAYSTFTLLKYQRLAILQKDFVNNMTHEFKTPLTSIIIASKQINGASKISEQKKLQYVDIINQQAQKLNEHIEKILQIAQSEQKTNLIQKKTFNLAEVFGVLKDNLNAQGINHDIKINDPLMISGDVFHLTNVFYNLIENSVKYGDNPLKIHLSAQQTDKGITVNYLDNGPGVQSDELQYLFEKFYRVQNQKTNKIKGFGLGLFYVKRIIDLHQWKISVNNHQPHGLKFSIFIPKKDFIDHG